MTLVQCGDCGKVLRDGVWVCLKDPRLVMVAVADGATIVEIQCNSCVGGGCNGGTGRAA